MPRVSPTSALDSRKLLVDRIAQSRYIAKSARLHDLLIYLCDRVIDEGADEIHEQEVGHVVFGRAKDYDTAADNIVRVHASTLRKRLEQFFLDEGRDEPIVIELPKGNYAPLFHERTAAPSETPVIAPSPQAPSVLPPSRPLDTKFRLTAALAVLFACSSLFLFWRLQVTSQRAVESAQLTPSVSAFWSSVFRPNEKTDIVLDDAALGLYQELDGRPIALSEYFDRSYLRRLGEKPTSNGLDPAVASAMLLKRHSSYASAHLLWQLSHTSTALGASGTVHFARDYSFRELKSNRAVLLGNSRSNPWVEPFDNRLGIRWIYDRTAAIYYPVDSWAGQTAGFRATGEHPDGYCSIALLPNLGGTGSVVILSGTGGSAAGTAGAFLIDEERMSQLRARLSSSTSGNFPYFEALLKIPSRNRLPRDAEIVIVRAPRN